MIRALRWRRAWAACTRLSRPTQFFLAFLAIASVTRLALAALLAARPEPPGSGALGAALVLGPLSDLRAATWLALPWWLVAAARPRAWSGRRPLEWLGRGGLAAALFGTLFTAAAELFFFEEFRSRFNFVAVDYLLYPTEVAGNIWQSYPTGWILAGIGALVIALVAGLERGRAGSGGTRWRTPAVAAGFALASALYFPASWPALAGDREVEELAANGYVTFWRALLGDGDTYRGLYAEADPALALARVQRALDPAAADAGRFATGTTARAVAGGGSPRRRNVVVVLEESFGSEFVPSLTPDYAYPVNLAPRLEALAREGTLFTHALSTGNRTIRAIEATTTSLPPLPGISIVRRSAAVGLFTLPGLLAEQGYRTEFVYGGRALFDEMGPYLERNGVQRVIDQADFDDDVFRTAWGVCDEAIFDRALLEMDQLSRSGSPFYLLVLTTSNHRPFRFPEQSVAWDSRLKARPNAVRYADHALGRFVEGARLRPYFDETLFVLMGDHGARVYGAAEIPLASYQVPILFLAPGLVPAAVRDDSLVSSLDVPPTVAGALGLDYESRFFGRDLFHSDPAAGRAFLTHNSVVALLRGERLAVLGLRGSERLFRYRRHRDELDPLPVASAADRDLLAEAVAFYQTADEQFRSGRYRLTTTLAAR